MRIVRNVVNARALAVGCTLVGAVVVLAGGCGEKPPQRDARSDAGAPDEADASATQRRAEEKPKVVEIEIPLDDIVEHPVFVHEEVEVQDHMETDRNTAVGQEDKISDISVGGAAAVSGPAKGDEGAITATPPPIPDAGRPGGGARREGDEARAKDAYKKALEKYPRTQDAVSAHEMAKQLKAIADLRSAESAEEKDKVHRTILRQQQALEVADRGAPEARRDGRTREDEIGIGLLGSKDTHTYARATTQPPGLTAPGKGEESAPTRAKEYDKPADSSGLRRAVTPVGHGTRPGGSAGSGAVVEEEGKKKDYAQEAEREKAAMGKASAEAARRRRVEEARTIAFPETKEETAPAEGASPDDASKSSVRTAGRPRGSSLNGLGDELKSRGSGESVAGVAVRPKWGGGGRRTGRRTWQDAIAGEELWVIARPGKKSAVPEVKDYPGQGELRAKLPGREKEIPLPLKHTDVKAEVAAFVATVNVTQQYHNPYGEKIEAVYVFPLPQDAAVTEFVMTIGDRHIRGIIRERQEAERIYEAAKRQGHVASLLTQERPNIFTQRIANIEPKKRIDVTITYFNTLKYSKGEYEFVFPMVVGPRFNPPGFTDGVGAVGRGRPGRSGQDTEVQYLKPGERSGHDISVTVDVDAGVEIEEASSPSHAVDVKRRGPSLVTVTLSPNDTIPNKDLVLRYRVAGKQLKTALMTHRGKTGNYFALVLQPPGSLADCPRMPREMVFVLDCSGSMSGWPMAKSKEAMRRALKKLTPDDTFQVIRFSNNASHFGPEPVPATEENIRRALDYVARLRGSGGTMMIEGIKAALDFPHDAKRFRVVSFLTDGYIGNENRILGAIYEKLGAARIFSFGVGSSPNRFLLEGMARLGRGAVAFITLNEAATDAVDLFYERASRPALTDVEIDWGGMEVSDVYPRRMPDLFVGRPVLVTGKFEGDGPARIRVTGRMGYEDMAFEVAGDLDAKEARHNGIAKIWARRKLGHLADLGTHEPSSELTEEMIATSLEYSVQCKHTAFVAVDSSRRTGGTHGTTVGVAVPVPDGVRYETTVEE